MPPRKTPAKSATNQAKDHNDEDRIIEVVLESGSIYHMTLKKGWKITYGRLQPHTPELTLRVYESKDVQLMCIPGVKSFRDIAINVEVMFDPPAAEKMVNKVATKKVINSVVF